MMKTRLAGLAFGLALMAPSISHADTSSALTHYEQGRYEQAFADLEMLAKADDRDAQFLVAQMYRDGRGVKKNMSLAIEWYLSAATQGGHDAQHSLGLIYLNGAADVQKDTAKAAHWLMMAAESGMAEAQFDLAIAYIIGGNLQPDPTKAHDWALKAAEQKHALAQNLVAKFYLEGRGVPKNVQEALSWFEKAAAQGISSAQNDLGAIYVSGGQGVTKDLIRAYAWFSTSAESGTSQARHNLDAISKAMTRTEIDEGKALARRFSIQYNSHLKSNSK